MEDKLIELENKSITMRADIEALFIGIDVVRTHLDEANAELTLLTQMVKDLEIQINGVEDTDENKVSE